MLSRGNWTLGDICSAIHDGSAILFEAMPMDASGLITEAIVYINNHTVTNVHVNLGTRPLIIDNDNRSFKSIGGGIDPGDVPFKMDILGRYQFGGKASQE